jgi:DnaK suppressor protein
MCPLDGDYEDSFAFRVAHRNMEANQMTNTDLTSYRARLMALRARLLGDMTQMEDDCLNDHSKTTSIPTDMGELGSDNADQELTSDLLGSDEDILDQIDGALKRMENGSFGQCEECGEQIPASRLAAIPYAAECVRCTSQREEGNGP